LGVWRGVNKFLTDKKILLRTLYTSLGPERILWINDPSYRIEEVGWGNVDWIGLAKDRNRWRALVNSVLNLQVP
jgi:hypothetical protein